MLLRGTPGLGFFPRQLGREQAGILLAHQPIPLALDVVRGWLFKHDQ